LPTGQPLTLVVYVDRSDGPTIAEAYGIDRTLAEVIEVWTDIDEAATDLRDIAPADARARILDAIEGDAEREPTTITENWPSEKALLEWVVDRMPEGGAGYEAQP
ncbi:hypothetical protein ACC691_37770, partial [Rhizobium johnstonii]|uniref:hypothetical protein n=1 Tax=Rhizobium johnstonii TaxID=3019933 RepID=UPI003F9DEC02